MDWQNGAAARGEVSLCRGARGSGAVGAVGRRNWWQGSAKTDNVREGASKQRVSGEMGPESERARAGALFSARRQSGERQMRAVRARSSGKESRVPAALAQQCTQLAGPFWN